MENVYRILVAIDMSKMAEEALKRAIIIAKEKNAQLLVIHVIEPFFIEFPFIPSVDEKDLKREVKEQVDRLTVKAGIEHTLFVESGSAASSIILASQKTKADLVIIGTHDKNDLKSNYFGSTALEVIQKTHIPVLIVKNEVNNMYKKMLLATNLSDYSKKSILFANALFNTTSRKYLYAFETVDQREALRYNISLKQQEKFKAELLSKATISLKEFIKNMNNAEIALIPSIASINEDLLTYIDKEEADLLVLGSKGVDNLNSFVFGSTASFLVQRASLDVLVYVPKIT